MYLWNYLSKEHAENGMSTMASIGYYDKENNVILFTMNEKKWQAVVPEGMTDRDAMILYMAVTVPMTKDFLDDNDKARLFSPVITEIMPVVPETQPEPDPEPEENKMLVVKCETCGLFYNAAAYQSCPFCKNESDTIIETTDEIEITSNEDKAVEELATVRFCINGDLHSFASVSDGETITLGRANECNIYCEEEKQLSRVHCTIEYCDSEKAFNITDRSLNGIFDEAGNRLPKDTTVKVPDNSRLWIATKAMSIELSAAKNIKPFSDRAEIIQPVQYFCNRCGGEYTPDSTFCPWCGNRVAQ